MKSGRLSPLSHAFYHIINALVKKALRKPVVYILPVPVKLILISSVYASISGSILN
jgi:hypothetical protein